MAKRDKLTKNQKRQVAKNRNSANLLALSGEQSHSKEGLIIGRFGNQADVLDIIENRIHRCFLRQHLGAPVPGDNVLFHTELNSNENPKGVIESIKERETLLERPSQHKGIKPIVANVNLIFVVVAPLPEFSSVLLDRYLVATNNANIETVIVVNKSDLKSELVRQNIDAILACYAEIGYPIINISANSNKGKDGFLGFAKDKASILVGQSGVGKSSIINLLLRSYDVNKGEILIDNKNLKSINLNQLKEHTGVVPQDVFLFSDTIENNIAFGYKSKLPDTTIIKEAAKNAAILKSIEELPNGLKTVIGERGVTLSGGQKQRISIARAIIKTPKILIFDDCLSAVDTETEDIILTNLKKIMKDRTSIIVSHRISSVKNADTIILLDDGKIIEQGTHNSLLNSKGSYYDIYQTQLLETEKNKLK